MGHAIFHPGMLPVAGTDDLTLNVRQFRAVWLSTLHMIDGIRGNPLAMSKPLEVSLDSLRYHAGVALAMIDAFLRIGGQVENSALEIPHIEATIQLYLEELGRVKQHWNDWVHGETSELAGVTVDDKSAEQINALSKPQPIGESMVLLIGGAAVLGVLYLMDK